MLGIITQKARSPAPWNYNPRLSEPGLCFYSQPSRNCNPGTLLNTLTQQRYKPFAQYPTIGRTPIVLARVFRDCQTLQSGSKQHASIVLARVFRDCRNSGFSIIRSQSHHRVYLAVQCPEPLCPDLLDLYPTSRFIP